MHPTRLGSWTLVCAVIAAGSAPSAHAAPLLGLAYDLLQDREGFVWAAGPDGVLRFDGVDTVPVAQGHAALVPGAHRLFQDRSGAVWIATGSGTIVEPEDDIGFFVGTRVGPGGLLRVQDGRVEQVIAPAEDRDHWVWALAEDSRGTMWAGTEAGLVKFDGSAVARFPLGDDPRDQFVTGLWFDGTDQLWLATGSGLRRFDQQTGRALPGPLPKPVFALVGSGKTLAFAATRQGAWTFDGREAKALPETSGVKRLSVGPDGQAWGAGERAPLRLDGPAPSLDATFKGTIFALLADADDAVWTGSADGVERVRARPWITAAGASSVRGYAVLATPDGGTWFTDGYGIHHVEASGRVLGPESWGREVPFVYSMSRAPDGSMWFAADGVYHWKDGRLVAIADRPEWTSPVREIAVDHEGAIWVANASGLWRYRDATFGAPIESYTAANGTCTGRLAFIRPTASGQVWLGSRGGLTKVERGRATCMTTADGLPANDVTDAFEDERGTTWLTTIGGSGLARVRHGRIDDVGPDAGLPRGGFYGVLEDHHGVLWLTSPQGVVAVARRDLEQGRARPLPFTVFTTQQGMTSDACTVAAHPAVTLNIDGRLWIPTSQGLSVIDTNRIRLAAQRPARITAVDLSGNRVPLAETIDVGPRPNRLDVHFARPDFDFGLTAQYRFMLVGHDADWQSPVLPRRAVYQDLRPGRYSFVVRSTHPGDRARAPDATLPLRVQARLTETLPFRAAVVATPFVAALLWILLRRRRDRAMMARVNAERTRIARELHDELAQLFMGLGYQIDALLAAPAATPSRATLEGLRALVDRASDEVHEAVWQLRAAVTERALERAIGDAVERARDLGLRVTLSIAGPMPEGGPVEHELPRILAEALTNAAKHGRARSVDVTLVTREHELEMRIVDDGEVQPPTGSTGGFGLVGMRERAAQCGGTAVAKPNEGGRGFIVEVHVPMTGKKERA